MMKKIMIKPGVSRPKITQYINLFYEGHFIKTNLLMVYLVFKELQ